MYRCNLQKKQREMCSVEDMSTSATYLGYTCKSIENSIENTVCFPATAHTKTDNI